MPKQRLTPELPVGKTYTPAKGAPPISYKKLVGNAPYRAGDAVLSTKDIVGSTNYGGRHDVTRREARDNYQNPKEYAKETQARITRGRYVNEDMAARGSIDRPKPMPRKYSQQRIDSGRGRNTFLAENSTSPDKASQKFADDQVTRHRLPPSKR